MPIEATEPFTFAVKYDSSSPSLTWISNWGAIGTGLKESQFRGLPSNQQNPRRRITGKSRLLLGKCLTLFFSVRHFPKHGKTPSPLPLPLPLGLQISAIARYPTLAFLKSCTISKKDDEKVWSRTNAMVGVKDAGSTVLGLSQNLSLYVQFSAPVKRGSKAGKEEEEKQDYYVNMGYAIRTLREEFLDIFYRELIFYIYKFEFDFPAFNYFEME
ncbi:hypothetical protein PVK06_004911 [Gossypium arboreum]|uniref:Uncharacterized protein n=1 Tax=Gossypium arboreum TaxID=29729 RepID=A0ABR0QU59_GOSAR|nr:hypothetical protein PVK06_004911 [Gossypium arboreum]